nr:hypothetical protein GCM10020093_090880 [Planobispora longispora]
MNHSRTPPRTPAVAAVAAAMLAGTALGPTAPAAHASTGRTGDTGSPAAPVRAASPRTASGATAPSIRFVTVSGQGGTKLAANVVTPGGRAGGRRHPLIVLPTSWSVPQVEYLAQAQKLAAEGYVVVTYNSRGFWQSGGKIEVAGPGTSPTPPRSSTGRCGTRPPIPAGSAWPASPTARASVCSPRPSTAGSGPSSR